VWQLRKLQDAGMRHPDFLITELGSPWGARGGRRGCTTGVEHVCDTAKYSLTGCMTGCNTTDLLTEEAEIDYWVQFLKRNFPRTQIMFVQDNLSDLWPVLWPKLKGAIDKLTAEESFGLLKKEILQARRPTDAVKPFHVGHGGAGSILRTAALLLND
jgi:hypothetical protein